MVGFAVLGGLLILAILVYGVHMLMQNLRLKSNGKKEDKE